MLCLDLSGKLSQTTSWSKSDAQTMNKKMNDICNKTENVQATIDAKCKDNKFNEMDIQPPYQSQCCSELYFKKTISLNTNFQYHLTYHLTSALNHHPYFSGTVTMDPYLSQQSQGNQNNKNMQDCELTYRFLLDKSDMQAQQIKQSEMRYMQEVEQIHSIFTYMKDTYTIEKKIHFLVKKFNDFFDLKEKKEQFKEKPSFGPPQKQTEITFEINIPLQILSERKKKSRDSQQPFFQRYDLS